MLSRLKLEKIDFTENSSGKVLKKKAWVNNKFSKGGTFLICYRCEKSKKSYLKKFFDLLKSKPDKKIKENLDLCCKRNVRGYYFYVDSSYLDIRINNFSNANITSQGSLLGDGIISIPKCNYNKFERLMKQRLIEMADKKNKTNKQNKQKKYGSIRKYSFDLNLNVNNVQDKSLYNEFKKMLDDEFKRKSKSKSSNKRLSYGVDFPLSNFSASVNFMCKGYDENYLLSKVLKFLKDSKLISEKTYLKLYTIFKDEKLNLYYSDGKEEIKFKSNLNKLRNEYKLTDLKIITSKVF